MNDKALNTFQGLPQWSKGIIAVAVVGGLGFIAYQIYKKLQEGSKLEGAEIVSELANDEYTRLLKSGQKLSKPLSAYATLSEKIRVGLDGCETYSTEYELIDEIKDVVKKPIDWFYLVRVFDSKMIDDCGWSGETPYALPDLLLDQLDSSYLYWSNDKPSLLVLREYLKSIGVTI